MAGGAIDWMAYWWVSQNQTHKQERDGGYLWAPKNGANGIVFQHWSNMTLVRPGDIVFSYAAQSVGAIGVALSAAFDAPQPREFEDVWHGDGWRVDVAYREIKPEVPLSTFVDDLLPHLPKRHSPITQFKKGVQGYLFAISPKAGNLICDRLGMAIPVEQVVADTIQQTVPDETTKEALVKARIGQGRWRRDLLRRWSGGCAITGLETEALLRASHIKPWRDANNQERLDVFNGLMLSPAYDAAFDIGLISFEDDGSIIISQTLALSQLLAAGISVSAKLSGPFDRSRGYLNHHRQYVFMN